MFKRIIFITVILLLVFPAVAGAHTHLDTSEPEEGSVLNDETLDITLTFDSLVQEPTAIILTHEDGEELSPAEITHEPADTVIISLPDNMEDGDYTLFYSIIGEDGHVMEEELSYSYEVTEDETIEEEESTEENEIEENEEVIDSPENNNSDMISEENESEIAAVSDDDSGSSTAVMIVIAAFLIVIAIVAIVTMRKKGV
ncbi:copper resistance protein CopC [Salipaludibacillus sp. HK11]|uniref:copper resistance CopC family protein n=1 Tax=Salipaludibacillus sp. HK11 TaxID=3394320 RepID=UPI0039FCD7AA